LPDRLRLSYRFPNSRARSSISVTTHFAGFPPRVVSHYLMEVAKLGGYLARTKDPPPGNMVVWRGLTRLTDVVLGFELNDQVVGN
jgi:hypothetical protein